MAIFLFQNGDHLNTKKLIKLSGSDVLVSSQPCVMVHNHSVLTRSSTSFLTVRRLSWFYGSWCQRCHLSGTWECFIRSTWWTFFRKRWKLLRDHFERNIFTRRSKRIDETRGKPTIDICHSLVFA